MFISWDYLQRYRLMSSQRSSERFHQSPSGHCWSCQHFTWDGKDASHYCAKERPEFPERCGQYEYEPGSDEQEREQC